MLEKPDLPDDLILYGLRNEYRLHASHLAFLPLGADMNTAVYFVLGSDGMPYFLKLRKGDFPEISIRVPLFLHSSRIPSIIIPMQTISHGYWASLGDYKMILYPFIEGKDAYEVALTEDQWLDFGAALREIHDAQLPVELATLLPREDYSPRWREMVQGYQAQAEGSSFVDPVAAELASFMRSRRIEIARLVTRANVLASRLKDRFLPFVLCHSDIHAGNLLLTSDEALYIVDWDNPLFAPKELDLILIGGSYTWRSPDDVSMFYQGYGRVAIDQMALAYYRCERIIRDIAEFCRLLLDSDAGGPDREQSLSYFIDQFLPGHEVELAMNTDDL